MPDMLARLSIIAPPPALWRCVGDSESSDIECCVPGRVAAFACPGRVSGTRLCAADRRFDTCVCDGAPLRDVGDDADVDSDAVFVEDTAPDAEPGAPVKDVGAPDVETDLEPDTPEPDVGPSNLPLGAPCAAASECSSESCVTFSTGAFCTEWCLGTCVLDEWVYFNRVCTPEAHWDIDRGEDGVGRCAAARCGSCPEFSLRTEVEFGRYDSVRDTGYELQDLTACVDVDECALDIAECPEGRICKNTGGGFACGCAEGYFVADCAECPGGADNICFGRGVCDDGNEGTGACDCEPRYGGDLCDQECFEAEVIDCSGADLADANLSGRDMSGGEFEGALMNDLDVSTAILAGANLTDVSAVGTSFTEATLTSATLNEADFTEASFREGVLSSSTGTDIVMTGATLTDAIADDFVLNGVNLTGANLSRVSLQRGNLSDAVAREAVLDYVEAAGGDARGADFTDASMVEFSFFAGFAIGTDFTRAILADADGTQVDFTGANLSGANMTDMDLTNGTLSDATLDGAMLTGVVWADTTCPDGTKSIDNGDTCEGHLVP